MPRRNMGSMVGVDTSEADAAIGFMQGLTAGFSGTRFTSAVLKYAHSQLSREFDKYMDGLAAGDSERTIGQYGHVYEWGMRGVPQGRLWKHTLKGHGKERTASWQWKASRVPIPKPEERAQNPRDPMSQVPDNVLARLSDRDYFFYWKAPVMEYNLPVRILPVNTKKLFWPMWNESVRGRHYAFRDYAEVTNPGGEESTGAFSHAWATYWEYYAPKSFQEHVAAAVEHDLGRSEAELASTAKRQRSRAKTVTLSTIVHSEAAFREGERRAQWFIDKLRGEYEGDDYEE